MVRVLFNSEVSLPRFSIIVFATKESLHKETFVKIVTPSVKADIANALCK